MADGRGNAKMLKEKTSNLQLSTLNIELNGTKPPRREDRREED